MIDLIINEKQLEATIGRLREKNIILPTFKQMKNPKKNISDKIKGELSSVGLWDVHTRNLFRITWKNDPVSHGGGFRDLPNYIELPQELTGVKARIIGLVGKWFPTGAHKVGATYGCLVPQLITGNFNPVVHKAVWPSTGNYCRGGAYNAKLLGCESIAMLPEEMSKERFEWLQNIAGEIITTPGGESNVKELYDKSHELMASPRGKKGEIHIFNQFSEFGNYLWHYEVTGHAIEDVLKKELNGDCFKGVTLTSGSAGTIGCGDYLKQIYHTSKIAAGEALQCPTILMNGYGAHRIEGIGDKHIPWIQNIKNLDMVIAIDDDDAMALIRLFNEPVGQDYLADKGISKDIINKLELLGISSVANVLMAIKMAKYFEMEENDVIVTIFTDSMELYQSRIIEMREKKGDYKTIDAGISFNSSLMGQKIDNMMELNYLQKRRIHNLKYFTWIEQQGKTLEELDRQWYDYDNYWNSIRSKAGEIDALIEKVNNKIGI